MSYKASYVPKKKRKKLNYKFVVPFALLVGVVCYIVVSLFFQSDVVVDTAYKICGLTSYDSRQLIKQQFTEETEDVVFVDYGMYGENFSFYQNEYALNERDPFSGKTIFLKNLCTGEEKAYMLSVNLDYKIPVYDLEDGFYQIEILDGLSTFRLVAESVIDDVFTSIARNDSVKSLRLIADSTFFDVENDPVLTKNYAYFEVSTQVASADTYDIILDPSGLSFYSDGTVNYGHSASGLSESKEMYEVATGIKTELEKYGLRVLILRDNEQAIDVFGADGRIAKAYEVSGKYYFSLQLLSSSHPNDVGATLLYSNFSTNRLASYIMKSLSETTSLKPSTWTTDNNMEGVYQTSLVDNTYDYAPLIRETGGKFTGAGSAHPTYIELNQAGSGSRRGMHSVVIEYGYINDLETYSTWMSQRDLIIKASAQGILDELGITTGE